MAERDKEKVKIYDMLVAGGGPGGCAAAFRASELGLSVLIVEYDDLMKRIRDYSKAKLILPGFGGADKMKFPKGGELIDALRFSAIDKDELVSRWRVLQERHKVPIHVGVELTGCDRRADGLLELRCWSHPDRSETQYLARNLVLALGNGVPRRFDIPGNTEGISFRLVDPHNYLGQPACVIGGGTSAAEAVIAISNAKASSGDTTAVYWSYRGDRLPRVSKALGEMFFEAYIGNGNIRYHPHSEPMAVVTGEDHHEYLSIRIDRKSLAERPSETTHLEFPKDQVVACIGEDLPEALLASLGIVMVHGGAHNKKRMVVNRFLETCQSGIYMVGDLLSQAYLQTDDFSSDPSTFAEVVHRGNIKAALRDGVLVAEVIRQRLDGKTEINVTIGDLEDLEEPGTKPSEFTRLVASSVPSALMGTRGGPDFLLQRLLPNGLVEQEIALRLEGTTSIGREGCDLSQPDDPAMAKRHALITHSPSGLQIESLGSEVFIVLPAAEWYLLEEGDLLRAGSQFLLVEGAAPNTSVKHFNQKGEQLGSYRISDKTLIMGRESPDVTLDRNDRLLSRRHLCFTLHLGRLFVKDLQSVNLSYLRLRTRMTLKPEERFQVGSSLFAVTVREAAEPVKRESVKLAPATKTPSSTTTAVRATGASNAAGCPLVTFAGLGKSFPVLPGQSICDVAEAHGLAIKAECHMGICGSDPIRILAGLENLAAPPDSGESETLEDICGLSSGINRLACKARIKGPVTVELLANR